MTRMVTHYTQEVAIERETGGGGGSILVRGIADAGKALKLMRRDLLESQGKDPDEIDREKEEGPHVEAPEEDEGVESNLDDFLTLLDTLDPEDSANQSDQGAMRKTMKDAKANLSTAVSSYQDYIQQMMEQEQTASPTSPSTSTTLSPTAASLLE